MQNRFEIKNETEGQCQSSPKTTGILTVLRCILGPNLEILSWIGGEWWQGQAQNMAIFYFWVKFDLEVQGQLPPKTIGILTKVFCSCGPNLVILAWTRDKLSRGQASAYRTHRQTDAANDNTRRPKLASGNKSINDNKIDNLYTSSLCLTRSVYILLMMSLSIADDVTVTRQLWCDHMNGDV